VTTKEGSILGGTMIVAGTCIGAGALALPAYTGPGGFIPASLFFLASAIVMACTGLLYLEICLWMDSDANIVSMARRFLGRTGQIVAWIVYLYLFYSVTVAYIAGSGGVISALLPIPHWLSSLLFTALFGPLVFVGPRAVDRTNTLLVFGLGLAYLLFIIFALPHVNPALLDHANWGHAWVALPVIFVSFGFQSVLPTLTTYLGRDPVRVRAAILFGTLLPFLAYMIWNGLTLGIVPPNILATSTLTPLRLALKTTWIPLVGDFFALFALASSFLGVTLGMRDFLSDGLHIQKTRPGRFALCAIVFFPALALALLDPSIFFLALRYGSGLGGLLLLAVLPITLVWIGRYKHKLPSPYRMKGGRSALLLLGAFVLVVLFSELVF
jgi:tyrosine-specific transport protein